MSSDGSSGTSGDDGINSLADLAGDVIDKLFDGNPEPAHGKRASGSASVNTLLHKADEISFISRDGQHFLNINFKPLLNVSLGLILANIFTGLARTVTAFWNELIIDPLIGAREFYAAWASKFANLYSDAILSGMDQPVGSGLVAFPLGVAAVLGGSWLIAKTWEVTFGDG